MKKSFITVLICLMAILTFTLTACGDDNNGTYYPTLNEMKSNLDKNGYKVNERANAEDMYAYYSKEQIEKYGVLAIEIKLK